MGQFSVGINNQRGAVYFGRHAQHELPTGWLFNSLADLGAGIDIVVNRFCQRGAKAMHGVSVEPDRISDAEDVTAPQP